MQLSLGAFSGIVTRSNGGLMIAWVKSVEHRSYLFERYTKLVDLSVVNILGKTHLAERL